MKRTTMISLLLIAVGAFAYAATFSIGVTIPQATDVTATLSRIDSKNTPATSDDTWSNNATAIDFSPLTFDSTYSIYRCQYYYALDVGTNGSGPWRIDHKVSGDFATTGAAGVGDNIVVTCVKQINDNESTPISQDWLDSNGKATLASSNDRSFTNTEIGTGWLRIYYGLYDGAASGSEVNGALPLTNSESGGTRTGTVSVTLVRL